MSKKSIIYSFFIITIFLLDRLSKYWAINNLIIEEKFEIIIFPYLSFNLIWNDGIAFGLFSLNQGLHYNILTGIILLITLIIFWMIIRSKGLEKAAFLMIFSGSLGNIFDRISYKSVPDFIDFHVNNFHWFIFNVADIFITFGVILLIYLELIVKKKK